MEYIFFNIIYILSISYIYYLLHKKVVNHIQQETY